MKNFTIAILSVFSAYSYYGWYTQEKVAKEAIEIAKKSIKLSTELLNTWEPKIKKPAQ